MNQIRRERGTGLEVASASKSLATGPRDVPGDRLLRIQALLALVLLALNDHLFKPTWPGWLTGKLSDAAGLIILPLLAVAVIEIARAIVGSSWRVSERTVWLCAGVSAVGFALVKTWLPAAHAYGLVVGLIRWPVARSLRQVVVTHDLTDLSVLPFACLAGWSGRLSRRRTSG